MTNKPFSNEKTPTPEELQKQVEEMMKQLGIKESPFFRSAPPSSGSRPAKSEPPPRDPEEDVRKFNKKPREVKEYLDRYVIRQDDAKKVLSVALCDHYNHVRLARENKNKSAAIA
ncbi:MAG: ATP-dependent protease, partial [Verrucomicrobia bacterium]|nr:ATP-dependent protease [Verrucomicrobiota bacterium]